MSRAAQSKAPCLLYMQSELDLNRVESVPPTGSEPQLLVHSMNDTSMGEEKLDLPAQRGMRIALDNLSYTVRSGCCISLRQGTVRHHTHRAELFTMAHSIQCVYMPLTDARISVRGTVAGA